MISWSTYSSLMRDSMMVTRFSKPTLLLRRAYLNSSVKLPNYDDRNSLYPRVSKLPALSLLDIW